MCYRKCFCVLEIDFLGTLNFAVMSVFVKLKTNQAMKKNLLSYLS